ncbi:hypothetical protein PhaeoP78_03890 (plasmid) [Phaeobacter inhibens]|nr:hypothetical protein PhaeoP78_03890 [Phaeobacter inhibens]
MVDYPADKAALWDYNGGAAGRARPHWQDVMRDAGDRPA